LYRTEICAILVYFLPNFGFHGNSLGSLENSGSIFEFINSVYLTIHVRNSLIFLHRIEICAILAYFRLNFGCRGNSFASLEIADSIFEFDDPENVLFV